MTQSGVNHLKEITYSVVAGIHFSCLFYYVSAMSLIQNDVFTDYLKDDLRLIVNLIIMSSRLAVDTGIIKSQLSVCFYTESVKTHHDT